MVTSDKGIDLIKHFEQFAPKVYLCPAGLPTIGYGTVIDSPSEEYLRTATLTEPQARELLQKELERFEASVRKFVKSAVSQTQFDALVSFAFNAGETNLKNSTLLKKINLDPNDPSIPLEFAKWKYSNGRVLKGLIRRRAAEAHLFKTGALKFDF